jgi:hypothetical protein
MEMPVSRIQKDLDQAVVIISGCNREANEHCKHHRITESGKSQVCGRTYRQSRFQLSSSNSCVFFFVTLFQLLLFQSWQGILDKRTYLILIGISMCNFHSFIHSSVTRQFFVEPWSLFQFLNLLHNR